MSKKRSRSTVVSDSKTQPTKAVVAEKQQARDGFANVVSRLGIGQNVDNQLSQGGYEYNLLTRNRVQLDAMYRGSWVVGKVIDSIAEDMARAGIDITSSEGAKDIEELQSGLSRLRIWSSLEETLKWARLYGGSIGVIMIDGQDLSTPLKIETIGKGQFTGIAVYDRWQINPDLFEVIRNGPDLGLPAYYYILSSAELLAPELNGDNNQSASDQLARGVKVHHSRVVRQIGVKLPFWQAITESMWGSSEIERLHDRLVSFDTATMSSANLINHAHLRTVKVDGLREILGTGGKVEEALIKMFDYMRLLQSNEGITLLDGNDDYASNAYSFAGLSDMMLQFGQQLSGASGIPLVRLFGQSPAGLNSTGESDIRNYYDNINAEQESRLRPSVDKIIRVAYQSLFGRPAPSDLQFEFASLWQMSPDQKATVARTKTETVAGAFESGLVTRAVAIKELRQQSAETGMFTNITDEDILEAEGDEPPMPGITEPTEEKVEPVKPGTDMKAVDSMFKTLMKKLGGN